MQQQKMTPERWGEMTPLQRDVAVAEAFGWKFEPDRTIRPGFAPVHFWRLPDGSGVSVDSAGFASTGDGMLRVMHHLTRPESHLSYRITRGAACVFSNIYTAITCGLKIYIEIPITSERDTPSALALAAVMAVEQQQTQTPNGKEA